MSRSPFLSDPTIIPRVQKYLESNIDKRYFDINAMADDLQRIYKDYGRRKRSPFRNTVKKAYNIVLQNYEGYVGNNVTSSEEGSEEGGDYEEPTFGDPLNNQLMDMYNRPKPLQENELIDISSDDSNDQNYPQSKKPTNGASSSDKPKTTVTITQIKKPPKPTVEETPNVDRGKKRKIKSNSSVTEGIPKKKKLVSAVQESSVAFKDIGGLDRVLETVCKLLLHIQHPELYRQIGISPPRGFLLHGPPGCGKTLLANAIAGELELPLVKVVGPELVAGVSGESEERIRELFETAIEISPCVLFIDEVDVISANRQNAQKEMERRIVAQLLSCLDELNQNEKGDRILVIGATNRPDSIDPALRRAGRFDREVCLGIPDVKARSDILKVITSKLKLAENFDFETVAKYTPGFVGADLLSLSREAAMVAINRVFNELKAKRELEAAIAFQKAKELLEMKNSKTEAAKETPTETKVPTVSSTESSEVDVNDQSNTSDGAVVVIDDDVKSSSEKQEVASESTNADEEIIKKYEESLQVLQSSSNSNLDTLISWLHEKAPLSFEQLSTLHINMDDFATALKMVQPSAKREGFATVPDVTWNDVGSLRNVREELQMAILAPVQHEKQCKALKLTAPTGVLLCGPPGCGKTLLAKAISNEAGINFIAVKGPELLNMYVGESERAVRVCFERARNSAPCVIFFDELDSLCPKRSETGEGGVTMRVVNQLLTEMDGIQSRNGVYILAATNRPDIIDPAILRPGRLDKIIYVGLPSSDDRIDILRAITKNGTEPQLAADVNLEAIGKSEKCDGYTGADLAALVREAGMIALKEFLVQGTQQQQQPQQQQQQQQQPALTINTAHFTKAVAKIRPSISEKDQKHYDKLKKIYSVCLDGDVEEMEYS